ncbi:MAG: acyl-CoA dehydrogenase family protein [Dehalococcoidia bacterium]|nr:acyl-CoA dehydrogenase family protein [Dehalococcoidia bacterium]
MWLPDETDLPEELKMLQTLLRKFIKDELMPLESQTEARGEAPPDIKKQLQGKMKELGIRNMWAPAEYGCAGLHVLGKCVAGEEIGRLSIALGWLFGDCLWGSVAREIPPDATEDQKQRFFIPLARGDKQMCVAFTEPNAGTDLNVIETTAVKKGTNYVINGSKIFITNADRADFTIVLAITDKQKRSHGGLSSIIVEKGTPGFKVARNLEFMGHRGVNACELVFEDCVVPVANLLGQGGDGLRRTAKLLTHGRLVIGAAAVGVAMRCLEASAQYAKQRVTFGQTIGSRQGVQWMLADMAMDIYAVRSMAYAAAREYDQGIDVRHKASMVKLYGTEMALRAADMAMQIHGGMGYSKDLPFEMLYRDWRMTKVGEGPSELMKHLVARAILAD